MKIDLPKIRDYLTYGEMSTTLTKEEYEAIETSCLIVKREFSGLVMTDKEYMLIIKKFANNPPLKYLENLLNK